MLLAEPDDRTVEIAQLLVVLGNALGDHEAVVAEGLNLQKVVERGNAQQLIVAFLLQNCLKQLARLAGRADNQTLAIALQLEARDAGRFAVEIF